MKKIIFLLFVLQTTVSFCQIESESFWPIIVQNEFNALKNQKVDTLLLYYTHQSPWNNLPESCKDFGEFWIIYHSDQYFAKGFSCIIDTVFTVRSISSNPFKLFVDHIKDFESKRNYFKKNSQLPQYLTDYSSENLLLMTNDKNILISISDYQRTDPNWLKLPWIKPTIRTIDITKSILDIE